MRYLSVRGAAPLRGELTVQSAKNSVLPILAATLLSGESCRIRRCPRLSDVENAAAILRHLGASVIWDGGDLVIDTAAAEGFDIPEDMMRAMRSSVIFLGAILARCGRAALSYPGGCELGPRPIDLHLSALRALGAEIDEQGGELRCRARQLHGGEIVLSFPSVGATENAILCACGARGTTVITNAAREPEIRDLQDFLVKMGARVYGAGSSTVTVEGTGPLHGCEHRCIGDRIAAATDLCAAAATGGEITLRVPYALLPGETPEGLRVYFLDDAGEKELCQSRYEAGFVTWTTSHLSLYMVDYEAPETGAPAEAPAQTGGIGLWIVLGVAALTAAVVITAVAISRKRRRA